MCRHCRGSEHEPFLCCQSTRYGTLEALLLYIPQSPSRAAFSYSTDTRRDPRRHASMGTKSAVQFSVALPVQWKVQGGSPEGTLSWVRQKGCFGADEKVVVANTGREAYAGGRFRWSRSLAAPLRFSTECRGR